MANDPKSPKGGKGKFDPDSVEELTDEEMEKVQGGIKSAEKSIATSTYLENDGDGPSATVISNYIDVTTGIDKKPVKRVRKRGS